MVGISFDFELELVYSYPACRLRICQTDASSNVDNPGLFDIQETDAGLGRRCFLRNEPGNAVEKLEKCAQSSSSQRLLRGNGPIWTHVNWQ